jgi:tetratricopeptide (TPR) repeat protein
MKPGLLIVSFFLLAADDLENAKRLIASGSPQQAVEILRRAVAADPKDADAQVLLGTALALVPRRAEAIEVLRGSVELRPDSAQAHLALGMALARFGERDEARKAYERVVALDPKMVMAHVNLGAILAAEEKLGQAVDHFSKAISFGGETAGTGRFYYLRGRVYRQQQLPEKAAADFEKAVQLDPSLPKGFLELGVTRAELEDYAGALEALQKAVQLAPEDAEASYQLGSLYLRMGKINESIPPLAAAAQRQPDDRNTLSALARALRAAGRAEEARPVMERFSKAAKAEAFHNPNEVKAGELNNEGIALEKQGKFDAALEKYHAAIALNPAQVSFRKNLALVLCRMERWREAVAELKEVLRVAPGDADATKALYIALEKVDEKR